MLDAEFYAPDNDEPDTPNSQVRYEILSIEPGESHAINFFRLLLLDEKFSLLPHPVSVDNENPENYEDLFSIINIASKYGRLETANPLRGLSGKWKIELRVSEASKIGKKILFSSSPDPSLAFLITK